MKQSNDRTISGRNFIFFGSPEFAEIVLAHLVDAGWKPSLVVCNPDRPMGRKKELTPPPVKQRIVNNELGSKVFQPKDLKESGVKDQLSQVGAEFAIVAAYSHIIPKDILDLFPLGAIGVHPSLLPKYRGPSPIRSAILAGEEKTGVTLYLMDKKMDNGPVLAQAEYPVSNIQYSVLHDALAHLSGELLVETLPKFVAGKLEPKPQNHDAATYTKFFTTEDGFVSERDLFAALRGEKMKKAEEIDRKIRALGEEPGTWTNLKSQAPNSKQKRVKLLEAHLEDNRLILDTIQVAGKQPQLASQLPSLRQAMQ